MDVLTGLHVWDWASNGWRTADPARTAAKLRRLGINGVIPHAAFTAGPWLYASLNGSKPIDRVKPYLAEGITVTVGIGRANGLDDRPADECIAAIVYALEIPYRLNAMLDWEGKYDLAGGKAKADAIADGVLNRVSDANDRITDCPWPTPLWYYDRPGHKQYTHPSAPYAEFGRLARHDRYGQTYKTGEDEALEQLAWARSPTQYPEIARKAGVPAWTIRGAFVTKDRSWRNVVKTTQAEPNQILWSLREMDAECERGLLVVKALREVEGGIYSGPGGFERFLAAQRLTPDAALAALHVA